MTHATAIGRQVVKAVQTIEVVDGQVRDGVWIGEPDVDCHAPASVDFEAQAAPADHAGAGRAEVNL